MRVIDLFAPVRVLVGAALFVIVVATLAQIFFRYVLSQPLIWSEEFSRLLLVWLTFLGAAAVAWDGRHLNVDVFYARLGPRWRTLVRAMNAVIAVAFLAIVAYSSVRLVRIENMQRLGSMDLPAGIVRLAATVGCTLMIAGIGLRIVYRRPAERRHLEDFEESDPI